MKTSTAIIIAGFIAAFATCAVGGAATFIGLCVGTSFCLVFDMALEAENKRKRNELVGAIDMRVDLSDDQQTVTCCGRDYPAQPAIALWRERKEEHIPFAAWFVRFYMPLLSWQKANHTTQYLP